MSTPNAPNAAKHPASQQARTPSQVPGATPSQLAGATPPVSTPFSNSAHAAFSPRGGPNKTSPQQFKKSPAVSLLGQLPHNLAFDSPSTAAALGLGGPANMPTHEAMEGFQDMRSITRDDDKLNRLEAILEVLGKKKGFVSEAGLERLAQRYGFECLSEDDTAPDGRKVRMLIIAGSSTSIEITMDNNIVHSVNLTFPESSEAVVQCMEPAGKILLQDLMLAPNQSPLTKTLDKFALNLERLTTLDKLSIMPAFDCRAAIAGLHASLQALHDWDLVRAREEGSSAEVALSRVICAKHGAPVMHAHDRVGLSLRYWKEMGHLASQKYHKTWQLDISCCPLPPPLDPMHPFPSARVSDQWLGKDIVRDDGMGGDAKSFPLDWQEPEHVSLPASDETKNNSVPMFEGDIPTGGPPQVSFLISFDPPIVLSSPDAARLYTYTGAPLPSPPPQTTFDHIVFPIPAGSLQDDPSENRVIQRQREVSVMDKKSQFSEKTHLNSLYVYKHIYSMEVKEMVFSHPKQLIDMLPLLRQWAFTSVLLENSFGKETKEANLPKTAAADGDSEQDQLSAFLGLTKATKPSASASAAVDLSIDVIIWVHPIPHFQVKFPFKDQGANITLQILENGVVDVTDENILAQTDNDRVTKEILGKVLEQMQDLCKWVEWIRSRLG
ncbi:uncharacterized protein J7T54_003945 [Emericellopsis cladophorae]|uniref:Mediator of RNA polymerase II transcription subunit 1 n=1 Tax=Emericellopsis cladophorae TaxID=2686198 RepID=A0A9P9Y2D4_9HYPO|nr:uncharacterized protein J7T54_003945 [Emericellopsis cladophorae]KAI6781679.1 hypothetical protein J7T54_003945 [Emericellopsis cladophorae]